MRLFQLLLFMWMSLGACMTSERGPRLDVFSDPEVRAFLACASTNREALAKQCSLPAAKINTRGEHGITPLVWLLQNDAITPSGVSTMIRMGADPFIREDVQGDTAVRYILAELSLTYLQALIEAGIDPNTDAGAGPEYSIVESVAIFWDDAKVSYLLERGLDLERRNHNGETFLLLASGIGVPGSPFKQQLFLLDHGANPHVKDKLGHGICRSIEYGEEQREPGGPEYRLILAKRLEEEFGIVCQPTERFRPNWR